MTNLLGRLDLSRMSVDLPKAPAVRSFSPLAAAARRMAEIAFCITLLMLTLPVTIIAAIAILIEGGGPVLFRQVRVGLNGSTFHVLKFRTMRTNAEANGPVWATLDDPRVTRAGAFLRKTRIDELPQLFNVMRGDMALVGPRPERPHFVELLASEIPFYHDRALIKPGITGWAQVKFRYGSSVDDARRKLEYDLYYLHHRSLLLDLLILALTVRVVVRLQGAR